MGCVGSKLDEYEAVALCKDRSNLLSEAIRLRYGLADAHAAYILSLRVVGDSLQKFFDGHDHRHQFPSHPSPVLTLPTQRKGDPMPPLSPVPTSQHQAADALPSSAGHHHLSRSNSGSHLHFNPSDSDFSDDDHDDGHLHSLTSSPFHQNIPPKTYANFAKKVPAPVVSYEIPPASPDVGYGYSYPAQSSDYDGNSYSYPYPSPSSGYGNFYGASSPPSAAAPSSSTQPPPPSPPKVSTWEFLNPFEAYSNFYPSYTPSRSSKDVREEEGIPDLEEDEIEVIKEAIVDNQKQIFIGSPSAHTEIPSSSKTPADVPETVTDEKHLNKFSREIEMLPTESIAVAKEEIAAKNLVPQSRAVSEAVKEINEKFLRASESCTAISVALEVGKRRYQQKRYGIGSARISLSFISKSSARTGAPADDEEAVESGSLSSTLQKLCIWENKLYEEVRAEEKMRQLHDLKLRLLKRLDERGAESDRISSTQAKVKKLATKIGVAIQVIDSISRKISILRDEELWPQINELIQSFGKMWKALMECHKSQCKAVMESTNLDAAASTTGDLAKELEFSFLRWIDQFCSWFNAQKNFAIALNSWLLRIIRDEEPEITADGIAPFSPGRLGAPPIFVLCNQWSQAMKSTSDAEVVEAMQMFATSVFELWRQQRRAGNQAAVEKDEQAINRAVAALNRKLVAMENPRGVRSYREMNQQRPSLEPHSLHEGLQQVFEAMEKLSELSLRIYEGLLVCSQSEQERASAAD